MQLSRLLLYSFFFTCPLQNFRFEMENASFARETRGSCTSFRSLIYPYTCCKTNMRFDGTFKNVFFVCFRSAVMLFAVHRDITEYLGAVCWERAGIFTFRLSVILLALSGVSLHSLLLMWSATCIWVWHPKTSDYALYSTWFTWRKLLASIFACFFFIWVCAIFTV